MTTTLELLLSHLDNTAETLLIDMRQVVDYTDYFLICSAKHRRHATRISRQIQDLAEENNIKFKVEQDNDKSWVIVDCGDVVVHIFLPETKQFYKLDRLWGMCPQEVVQTTALVSAS